jgi:hypothetical protein
MSIFHRSEDAAGRDTDRRDGDPAQDHPVPADAPDDVPEDTRSGADARVAEDDRAATDTRVTENDRAAPEGATAYRERGTGVGPDRQAVIERQRERYGGVKVGAAFFGWLAAMGTAVLLTALLAAGTTVSVAKNTEAAQAVGRATRNGATVGLAGGIALLVILFVAYYCGGYVAGRMARFNGATQGVAVWVVAVVIAAGVALLGATAGSKYNILGTLNSFPRIPVDEGTLTRGGIVALLLGAVVTLVGAVLGGVAGMRYHRNVDRVGLEA